MQTIADPKRNMNSLEDAPTETAKIAAVSDMDLEEIPCFKKTSIIIGTRGKIIITKMLVKKCL